jgi:hypothetical protein
VAAGPDRFAGAGFLALILASNEVFRWRRAPRGTIFLALDKESWILVAPEDEARK